jgi:hypothetical protein
VLPTLAALTPDDVSGLLLTYLGLAERVFIKASEADTMGEHDEGREQEEDSERAASSSSVAQGPAPNREAQMAVEELVEVCAAGLDADEVIVKCQGGIDCVVRVGSLEHSSCHSGSAGR